MRRVGPATDARRDAPQRVTSGPAPAAEENHTPRGSMPPLGVGGGGGGTAGGDGCADGS